MSDSHGSIPPLMMLRSFLTVGSGYILHMIVLFTATFLIGQMFPEFLDYLRSDAPEAADEIGPFGRMPVGMFWTVVIVVSAINLIIGAVAIWVAPFSPLAHACFIAAILFVNYLQNTIAATPEQKSMTLVFVFAFPISILVGAFWANTRATQQLDRLSSSELV